MIKRKNLKVNCLLISKLKRDKEMRIFTVLKVCLSRRKILWLAVKSDVSKWRKLRWILFKIRAKKRKIGIKYIFVIVSSKNSSGIKWIEKCSSLMLYKSPSRTSKPLPESITQRHWSRNFWANKVPMETCLAK